MANVKQSKVVLPFYSLAFAAFTPSSATGSTESSARTTPSCVHAAISLPACVYHCYMMVNKSPERSPRRLTRQATIARPFAAAGA
jgi:hypothetical protein